MRVSRISTTTETMEKIESDLKESEFKQRSLAKAYDIIHAQANSFLIFTVQWKDLEDHFESTRNSLETRFRELEAREEDIGVRETKLEAEEWNFRSEKEAKACELRGLHRLIDQKLKEVTDCKNHLHSLFSLIQEHSDEVIVQENRLMEVEKFVREKEMEFDSIDRRVKERTKKLNWVEKIVEEKEMEFDSIDQRVKEGTENLNWVEKILEEKSKLAESKEEEVKRFQEALNKYVEDIELKKRQLNEILGSIEKHKKEFDLKEELVEATKRSIEECDREFILKEEKLKLIQKSLVECSNTLESREKNIKEMDLKERDFGMLKNSMEEWSCKLDFRARELELMDKRVSERFNKVKLKEKNLDELQKSIRDGEKHLDKMSKGLQMKEGQLEDQVKELALRQKEVDSIKKSNEEHTQNLESKERQLEDQAKELELKQKELFSIKKSTEEHTLTLKLKERQLEDQAQELALKQKEFILIKNSTEEHNGILKAKERQLEDQAKELELKQKEFDSIRKSSEELIRNLKSKERQLEDQAKELELKQKEFDSIKKSTEEHTRNLKSKEMQLEDQAKELELKQKEFDSIKKSTEEHTRNLKAKERQLEVQAKELELKQKEFDSIRKSTEELIQNMKERQLEQKEFDSIRKSCEEHIQNMKSKKRQIEDQAKGIELKQKEFDLIKKSTQELTRNLKAKEKINALHSQVKIEQLEYIPSNQAFVPSSAINQSSIYRDGRGLQLFMNEHLKRIDLVGSEISAVLEASLDPAKLVLDAMQGFYPSNSTVDNRECNFELRVIRRSCILLLEALKKVSPQINPLVREEAIKLAGDWKAKMTGATENWLEILGFLRLVTTYEITSEYDGKELQSLVATIAEYEQATELSQALGSTEKGSASIIFSPVKTEKPESSLTKNAAGVSSPNLQLTATTDARNLQGFVHELARGNHLIQSETLAALQTSLEPAKFVLDVMQNSFAQYWGNGDVHSKETVMLSYINLLEQLISVSPHVGPHVKDDARKLAIQWKAKMGADTQNSLEHLGFLQFIATYGLFSTFPRYDMVSFLGRISQDKQTRELCQKLSFADKIPAHFILNLIERGQLIEAVRLICTFKLIDTFPPVPLLEKFVENTKNWNRRICKKKKSLDEKVKVLDNEIADLRAVIQCIKDCNLESVYQSGKIELQIAMVEKIKEGQRHSVTSLACKVGRQEENKSLVCEVEQHEQSRFIAIRTEQQEANKFEQQKQTNWNKRRGTQPHQQQQHPNKFQRTGRSAARLYRMPTSCPGYQHRSVPSWQHENYRHPGQFGMYANDYNTGAMPNSGIHRLHHFTPSPPPLGTYQP
ncbi:Frigida-like protein [Prunus dulcis]|uniref:Frigida-like protein n=1 Tax=Prunus dulcis TaxID=3755 RepID=A0A4Y1RRS2_PRUDU|nr:Frigida-like protein [Prunus dulcis]